MNLEILVGSPEGSPLVRDYVQGESHLAPYFAGDYRSREAYRQKAGEVDTRFDRDGREGVRDLIHDPTPGVADRLEEWVEKGGYLVTTGQQPGLFLGPLYTLYKALTSVRLARALEPVLGKPVLPLFWVASEDHDWDESAHTHLPDLDNEIRTLRVPPQEGSSRDPLHRIGVRSFEEMIDELAEILPGSDFRPRLIELVRDAYPEGATLSDGFLEAMKGLLSHLPIIFVGAHQPKLKHASLPVLLRELEDSEEHEALLSRVASRLEMDGYHAQVPVLEGGVNLFLEGPEGRDRIFRDGPHFRLRRADLRLSADEIRSRVRDDPSVLSPNVLLRPVVESTLFPTVAYVAGPGEVAYYAQLRDFFDAHGIRMPVIHPRHSVTLVEAKIRKVLDKFHLSVDGMDRPHHELAGEIARDEIPPEIRKALGEIRGAIGRGSASLVRAVKTLDGTLKGPVTHARNAAFAAFDETERKILQAVKRENEIALGQLEKAQSHLYPKGKPQERVTNPFYYLSRYGPELVDALVERFDVDLDTETT